jgi:hypothetical protein
MKWKFFWVLLFFCFCGCSNPGEMLTSGAVQALTQNADTLRSLTRSLTQEATTIATMHVSGAVRTLTGNVADTIAAKLDTQRNRFAQAVSSGAEQVFASGEAHAVQAAHRIESDLLSAENLRYAGKLRDTLTGAPVQNNVRSLVRVAFQEFRKQQDSTLKPLRFVANPLAKPRRTDSCGTWRLGIARKHHFWNHSTYYFFQT